MISGSFFALAVQQAICSDLMAKIIFGFPRKRGSLLHPLLFASMLTVALGVLSVAPDDFVSECTKHAELGSFNNSNQKVLLDTQFYPSTDLLTLQGEDKIWISLDIDMTTGIGMGKVRKRGSELEE